MKFFRSYDKKINKVISKAISCSIAMVLLTPSMVSYSAIDEDQAIASSVIANEYTGRVDNDVLLKNIRFEDVSKTFWGNEAITRLSSLDIIKGYDVNGGKQFRPNAEVSNQEALTFIMRSIGLEEEAKLMAETTVPMAEDDTTGSLWAKGYLMMANQTGLIDNASLADAIVLDQTVLDPTISFMREDSVTREQMAMWLVQGINFLNPGLIEPLYRQQNIFNYSDWEDIGIDYIPYIEAVIRSEIMVGDGDIFNPKGILTRAEMIQAMENMDTILYDTLNVTVKSGYVGHIEQESISSSGGDMSTTSYYIRRDDGSVDKIITSIEEDMNNRITDKNAIVYNEGVISDLSSLKEGDNIHYIVDELTKEVYYIEVKSSEKAYHTTGILRPFTGIESGQITLLNSQGTPVSYTMTQNLYDPLNKLVTIDDKQVSIEDAPVTDTITLTIKNQMVTGIAYGGTLSPYNEISGLVIEHNTDFNYLRISDWNGKEVIKKYNEGDVTVEKEAYYDNEDQVGYFDELFPYYGFDEDDALINDIEQGDIVHVKLYMNNLDYIEAISAKTNYTVKFGEIITTTNNGDDGIYLTMEMDDRTIVSYTINDDIPVIKGQENVSMNVIESGDIVRLLVNQAVVSPGTISENIKEINIDPYGNIAEKVYRGELGNINKSQETFSLINSFELNQTGWTKFTEAYKLDISGEDVEYYYKDKQITLDYADKYLRREGMDTYVVTEKYFTDEKVKKVTFREGRDSVIDYSNVALTNGFNEIKVTNHDGDISFDQGTIVIKNNKIISPSNIIAPDYAQIVLNGENQAAVITVRPEPNNDGITIFRGRVARINELEDFTVQSHAVLSDMEWIYSPIERTFVLDYKTVIQDEEDLIGVDEFIGYSDISKIDEVYTIISDGITATYVSTMPYAIEGVMGEVYQVDSDGLHLKDTLVYDGDTKEWNELSLSNSYSYIEVLNQSIILKNNKVVDLEEIEIGDRLNIMTTIDLAEQLKLEDLRTVPGYIIRVE